MIEVLQNYRQKHPPYNDVIKFVSDLRQVVGFLWIHLFSSINKTDCHDITEILLSVALNTIILMSTHALVNKMA